MDKGTLHRIRPTIVLLRFGLVDTSRLAVRLRTATLPAFRHIRLRRPVAAARLSVSGPPTFASALPPKGTTQIFVPSAGLPAVISLLSTANRHMVMAIADAVYGNALRRAAGARDDVTEGSRGRGLRPDLVTRISANTRPKARRPCGVQAVLQPISAIWQILSVPAMPL